MENKKTNGQPFGGLKIIPGKPEPIPTRKEVEDITAMINEAFNSPKFKELMAEEMKKPFNPEVDLEQPGEEDEVVDMKDLPPAKVNAMRKEYVRLSKKYLTKRGLPWIIAKMSEKFNIKFVAE